MAHRKHHRRATRRNPSPKRPTKASRAANARAQRAEEKALRAGLSMDRAKMYPYPGPRPARTKRSSARARARKASGLKIGGATKRRAAVTHDGAVLAARIKTGDRVIVVRGTPPGEKRTHAPKIVYSANVGGLRYNPSKPGKRRKAAKGKRRNPSKPRGHKVGCRCVVCKKLAMRSNPSRPKHRKHARKHARRNPSPPRSSRTGRFLRR